MGQTCGLVTAGDELCMVVGSETGHHLLPSAADATQGSGLVMPVPSHALYVFSWSHAGVFWTPLMYGQAQPYGLKRMLMVALPSPCPEIPPHLLWEGNCPRLRDLYGCVSVFFIKLISHGKCWRRGRSELLSFGTEVLL